MRLIKLHPFSGRLLNIKPEKKMCEKFLTLPIPDLRFTTHGPYDLRFLGVFHSQLADYYFVKGLYWDYV